MVREDEHILFLGDSYTWGEGLELYSNKPKWVLERMNINQWVHLKDKQDDESFNFRNKNRFSHLTSSHFGCKDLVDHENGGAIQSMIRFANESFMTNNKINNIVIQFSSITRDAIHGTFDCMCDMCTEAQWPQFYYSIINILNKKSDNIKLDKGENILLEYTENKVGLSIDDNLFLDKFELFFINNRKDILKKIYYTTFHKWIMQDKKLYFIDSWEEKTSDILFKIPEYNQHFIPLIGYNNKKYKKWKDWNITFDAKTIMDDFPNTHNAHPSLIQHEYLAKSIIESINEKII